jgi:hypothetical protein
MATTVTQAATKIIDSFQSDRWWTIKNTGGTNALTLSRSSGVVAGTGFALAPGASQQVWMEAGEQMYGICASGLTTTVDVI